MEKCIACDLMNGSAELPGGRIYSTEHWVVEHCIGPMGIGALVVKPKRHCIHYWELTDSEVDEVGGLLKLTSSVIEQILHPDQVYICLWSHANWTPGHIHFVLQPVFGSMKEQSPKAGPFLQVEMANMKNYPQKQQIEEFAEKARCVF